MRALFESLGIKDIVAKSTGSSNPHNMIKATFEALSNCCSPRSIAAKRGKKVSDIISRRRAVPGVIESGVDVDADAEVRE